MMKYKYKSALFRWWKNGVMMKERCDDDVWTVIVFSLLVTMHTKAIHQDNFNIFQRQRSLKGWNLSYGFNGSADSSMHAEDFLFNSGSQRQPVENSIDALSCPDAIWISQSAQALSRKPNNAFISAASWLPLIKWTFFGYMIFSASNRQIVSRLCALRSTSLQGTDNQLVISLPTFG